MWKETKEKKCISTNILIIDRILENSIEYELITVEPSVTRQTPYRSRRTEFPYRALQEHSLPQGFHALIGFILVFLYRLGRPTIRGFSIPNCSINCKNPTQL